MIKYNTENEKADIEISGKASEVMTELVVLIHQVYLDVCNTGEKYGEIFKSALQKVVADDSDLWEIGRLGGDSDNG